MLIINNHRGNPVFFFKKAYTIMGIRRTALRIGDTNQPSITI